MNPRKFFEEIKLLEKSLKGMGDGALMIESVVPIPNFGDSITDTHVWIVCEGAYQWDIPKWCLDINLAKNPRVKEMLEQFRSRANELLAVVRQNGVTVAVGFESRARIAEVGEFVYFR